MEDITHMVTSSQAPTYLCGSGAALALGYHTLMSDKIFFLREWREQFDLTQEKIAEAVEKSVPTIQRWESGRRMPGIDDLGAVAKVFRVHPAELLRPPLAKASLGVGVVVRGAVQAGAWSDATEWPEADHYSVPMPPTDPRFPGVPLFGLEVRGPSMNKVFPEGTILACASLIHNHARLSEAEAMQTDKFVIAERIAPDGTVEATVKQVEVVEEDGKKVYWLCPRSDDPRFQAPFRADGDNGYEVRVTALVVRSSRPE